MNDPTLPQAIQLLNLFNQTGVNFNTAQSHIEQSGIIQDIIRSGLLFKAVGLQKKEPGALGDVDPEHVSQMRVGLANVLLAPIIKDEKRHVLDFVRKIGIKIQIPPIPFTLEQIVAYVKWMEIAPDSCFLRWIPGGIKISHLQEMYPEVQKGQVGDPIKLTVCNENYGKKASLIESTKKALKKQETTGRWVLWCPVGLYVETEFNTQRYAAGINELGFEKKRRSLERCTGAKATLGTTVELLYLATRHVLQHHQELLCKTQALWTSDSFEQGNPHASLSINLRFCHMQPHIHRGLDVNDYFKAVTGGNEHTYIMPLVSVA